MATHDLACREMLKDLVTMVIEWGLCVTVLLKVAFGHTENEDGN